MTRSILPIKNTLRGDLHPAIQEYLSATEILQSDSSYPLLLQMTELSEQPLEIDENEAPHGMTRINVDADAKPEMDHPDMDEQRRRKNAEYYAKRLNEVRNWLADCLGEEEIPQPYELEEDMRSGILLARLANYFSPTTVSLEKIFDLDGVRFHDKDKGLHYRHTDNIMKWRKACQTVNLNPILLPDPSDIYAGRNVRTVFALIALAKRLYRYGKAPPIREHIDLALTDEDYQAITKRMDVAAETEGIDWDQMQLERQTVDSGDFGLDRSSLAEVTLGAEEIFEMPNDDSFSTLRYLCKTMNLSGNIYEADFLIEDQKMRLNKLLESNEALKVDLEELEADIGLLVKNFRSIKDNNSDKRAEQEHKQEIEKPCMQASSAQNLSDDSVYEEHHSASSYDEEEPRSLAQVSRQTAESRSQDERVQYDHSLKAKASILTLFNSGVGGESIKELVSSTDFVALDDNMRAEIEETQKILESTLQKLIEKHLITDENDLLPSIFKDIRDEASREQIRKERKEVLDKMMDSASKNAQQMMSQIDAYRKYEQGCLMNMTGGAPSINLTEAVNKKVKKFLNRKLQAVKKDPIKLSSEKMIKKKILFMDDITTPKRVSKFSMIITPLDEPGHYRFESILDGQIKHTQTIVFEELLRREALGQFRMNFDDPLVFDCLGLRRYLDNKFHSKCFN